MIVGRRRRQTFIVRAAPRPGRGDRCALPDLMTSARGRSTFDAAAGRVARPRRAARRRAGGDRPRAVRAQRGIRAPFMLDGKLPDLSSPHAALRAGHRAWSRATARKKASRLALSVRENTFLNPVAIGRSLLSFAVAAAGGASSARAIGADVGLRPNDPDARHRGAVGRQPAEGGGRRAGWRRAAELLIAEDPTAGVDVGAKAEIYRLIARRSTRASRSSWSPPTSRRSRTSATAPWSSRAARSSPRSTGAELTTEVADPRRLGREAA